MSKLKITFIGDDKHILLRLLKDAKNSLKLKCLSCTNKEPRHITSTKNVLHEIYMDK